jgi:DNA-directed RNA polymerase subunit RPC12/RpoP
MSGTIIECIECGRKFVWSYDQQRDFRARGWDAPKRCPDCRSRRRYERQSGMRGLVGLSSIPPASLERKQTRPAPSAEQAPLVPLWRDLSRAERYRYLSRFMHLDSAAISSLNVTGIALLMQWIFERRGIETNSVEDKSGRLDLALTNKKRKRSEFARFYYRERGIPINALWDLLNTLKGTQFVKIHCFTADTFTKAQKRIQSEFPLALNLVDREGLGRYLYEAQQSYRTELARRSARRVISVPRKRRTFVQKLLTWLRGSL